MSRFSFLFLVGCAPVPSASSIEDESASIEAISGGGVSTGSQDGVADTGQDNTQTQDTGSQSGGFLIDGQWTYSGGVELENTCPDLGDSSSSEVTEAGFSITSVSDSMFDILLSGSAEPFSCTLTDLNFVCNPTTSYETFDYEGFDVTIGITTTYTGSFVSQQQISSEYQVDVFCDDIEWVGCDVAPELPCVVRFTADAYK